MAPDLRGSVHEEGVAWFREARGATGRTEEEEGDCGRRGWPLNFPVSSSSMGPTVFFFGLCLFMIIEKKPQCGY